MNSRPDPVQLNFYKLSLFGVLWDSLGSRRPQASPSTCFSSRMPLNHPRPAAWSYRRLRLCGILASSAQPVSVSLGPEPELGGDCHFVQGVFAVVSSYLYNRFLSWPFDQPRLASLPSPDPSRIPMHPQTWETEKNRRAVFENVVIIDPCGL